MRIWVIYTACLMMCVSIPVLGKLFVSQIELESGKPLSIETIKVQNKKNQKGIFVNQINPSQVYKIHSIQFDTNDINPDNQMNSKTIYHLSDIQEEEILNQVIDPEVLQHFKVAPSPMQLGETSFFGYRLSMDMAMTIEIYDRRGRRLSSKLFEAGEDPGGSAGYNLVPITQELLGGDLPAGLYYALLRYEGTVKKRTKFEVQP